MTKSKNQLITKARKDESTKEEIYFQEERDCFEAESCESTD
jgi:hypothetical protein